MQDKIKALQDAKNMTDEALTSLSLVTSALTVTLDSLDHDVVPPEWQGNPAAAIHFAKRFPIYADTLSMILRNMQDACDSLRAGVEGIFAAHRKEGKD